MEVCATTDVRGELLERFLNCAASGDLTNLRKCLEAEPEVMKGVDMDGFSALMIAAAEGQVQVVEALLTEGANDSYQTFELKSIALHFAAKNGSPELVRQLCVHNHASLIDAMTIYGETPLIWACIEGRDLAVEVLLEYGASTSVRNEYGATPLVRPFDVIRADGFTGNEYINEYVHQYINGNINEYVHQ